MEKGIVSLVIMILLHGRKMIQYATQQAKEPVWACHYKNTASEKWQKNWVLSRCPSVLL